MPARRRGGPPTVAAALPTRRLPIGTPQVKLPRRGTKMPPTKQQPPTNCASDVQGDDMLRPRPTESPVTDPFIMDVHERSASIAEAKLQRQRQRNEEMDPTVPLQSRATSLRQSSRQRHKQWKTFGVSADSPALTRPSTPTEPESFASSFRVNSFRNTSRNDSASRPTSALSHTLSEQTSEFERRDSSLEVQGFQVYKTRRNRKDEEDMTTGLDTKVELRQTSVEAPYNNREVYEVFGNALPGREFLEQTVGYKNGQIQFLKHPNGDISAHQWSEERYQWENIGQFSNVRKRTEGQLASGRLSGETASQTLQQNTLAYFRTIAKQREASVMGIPFGQREIQALMPVTQCQPNTTNESTSYQETQHSDVIKAKEEGASSAMNEHDGNRKVLVEDNRVQQVREKSTYFAAPPTGPKLKSQRAPIAGTAYMQNFTRYDDPFVSDIQWHYPAFPGGHRAPWIHGSIYNQLSHVANHMHRVNFQHRYNVYGNHLGNYYGTNIHDQGRGAYSQGINQWLDNLSSHSEATNQSQHHLPDPSLKADGGHCRSEATVGMTNTPTNSNPLLHSKQVNSFDGSSHKERLGQLVKIGDAARERNSGHANIRTVLYDPLRNVETISNHISADLNIREPTKTDRFNSHIALMTIGDNAMSSLKKPSEQGSRTITQLSHGQSSPVLSIPENNLKDSSPDTTWAKRPYEHSNAFNAVHYNDQQDKIIDKLLFQRNPTTPVTPTNHSHAKEDSSMKNERLHQWWTSSERLSRHNHLFQRIRAASAGTSTLSAQRNPNSILITNDFSSAASPRKANPSPGWDETITRLLIPVQENLASYVQGPPEQRRDYFCPWRAPPSWAVDHGVNGNKSFYVEDSSDPLLLTRRDSRYRGPPAVPRLPPGEVDRGMQSMNRVHSSSVLGQKLLGYKGMQQRFGTIHKSST